VGIQKRDHERIAALDPDRVNREELRHPVRHDLLELLAGYGREAAQDLGALESSVARG
jgi:hypothetical protein